MCWKCGNSLKLNSVSRSDVCPVCDADVRSCRNCLHYSPGSHYDCHETVEDPVSDKERSNMCDFFKLNPDAASSKGGETQAEKAQKAKAAFDALFS